MKVIGALKHKIMSSMSLYNSVSHGKPSIYYDCALNYFTCLLEYSEFWLEGDLKEIINTIVEL